ncbi:SAICAR synthase-like protein [Rhizophagus irregularis]|uniref:Phosphoribosylaminoimidazole-succinocarboxamide synthase n=1 Tax=Rhizophagus irregularis TaxID=588596 RepID=A0A2I1GDW8_9GLOM|nr:SAICAR synthase-like protein [Rhizophagus irregularis]
MIGYYPSEICGIPYILHGFCGSTTSTDIETNEICGNLLDTMFGTTTNMLCFVIYYLEQNLETKLQELDSVLGNDLTKLMAKKYALTKGIIIADTKFEFGRDDTGILYIVDEVLTPDSSRFWLSLNYEVGKSQESFDKQYLRNYLLSIDFDKKTSIELPNDIVTKTMERYIEAYKMITDSDPTF